MNCRQYFLSFLFSGLMHIAFIHNFNNVFSIDKNVNLTLYRFLFNSKRTSQDEQHLQDVEDYSSGASHQELPTSESRLSRQLLPADPLELCQFHWVIRHSTNNIRSIYNESVHVEILHPSFICILWMCDFISYALWSFGVIELHWFIMHFTLSAVCVSITSLFIANYSKKKADNLLERNLLEFSFGKCFNVATLCEIWQ